ncbi:type I-E CRISPR-associated protein Cse2/CasB [Streptomyces sp. MI02-7b]|uniref:type I-E CRISPR-associated protein Cse2/CasB n=1 Tax=Streptomyces sp. MI02-7b TaxID=462941 RepID=UPI0029B59AEA|nr:type I-E CRISPR-associated protein Cse2/CasB [Streptomyces sp. MI02-7b]MDX3077860.1 type I-E CRISPR-associated protein Cse2/CasB [Streptomyces sp. MI02-7b]
MTPTAQRRAHYDAYVADVISLCTDNGTRARLRTGRGQPVHNCRELHRYLTVLVADHGARRAHYTVAACIALHRPTPPAPEAALTPPPAQEAEARPAPSWRSRPNLGAALARAVHRCRFTPSRAEDQLHTLTRLEADTLHPRLPSLTERLVNTGTAVDWAVLLDDLAWWDSDHDHVATRWLESYYLTLHTLTQTKEP